MHVDIKSKFKQHLRFLLEYKNNRYSNVNLVEFKHYIFIIYILVFIPIGPVYIQ